MSCLLCGSTNEVRHFALTVDGVPLRIQPDLCRECGDTLLIRSAHLLGTMVRNGKSGTWFPEAAAESPPETAADDRRGCGQVPHPDTSGTAPSPTVEHSHCACEGFQPSEVWAGWCICGHELVGHDRTPRAMCFRSVNACETHRPGTLSMRMTITQSGGAEPEQPPPLNPPPPDPLRVTADSPPPDLFFKRGELIFKPTTFRMPKGSAWVVILPGDSITTRVPFAPDDDETED